VCAAATASLVDAAAAALLAAAARLYLRSTGQTHGQTGGQKRQVTMDASAFRRSSQVISASS